ncbi:hypothetical protein [Marinobacter salexigens]|uniref:RIFT barrel domain-containing protein n=1 Tax=Marinobacter salexigens TaxID=1925763 RepID=UPI000C28C1E8|nr:hypothetical protein [Marinobacter salexigens]
MEKKITIRLEEKNHVNRIDEPAGLSVPLPKGVVQTAKQLELMDGQHPVTTQFDPLAHWPDGSIRWVHINFLTSLDPGSEKKLTLSIPQGSSPASPKPLINRTSDVLLIQTSTGSLDLKSDNLTWQVNNKNGTGIPSTVTLSDETGMPCTAKVETNWEVTRQGPVFVAATIKGQWLRQNNDPLARFECELRIFLETGLVQVELTTHNPKRARHSGGLWDLGDPGSVYFLELAVETTLPAKSQARITAQAIDEKPKTIHLPEFNLYQDSSGGENWQSRNHIDCNGEVTTQFCGYKLLDSSALVQEGKRANPLISIVNDCGQLDVAIPDFWQNFPTSVRKNGNMLTIGLFPEDAKKPYELQGGEQKTLRFMMTHNSDNSLATAAYTPLTPVITPESYEHADAFPWFKANTPPSVLDELIAEGLNGTSNFFAKREVIDEFGWRNFGDIFADHEILYQKEGELPFISHYNNQYDPIYGFARQFALTGDQRWFRLMDDLARHVVDIDIYHTEEDRAEYNHGLFWHTDHYLDAYTATHRTFSRHNSSSSTPGQTGGGPAEEHCYSTGLLYHHYLTGSQRSRQAVLGLARWMTALHEGQGGFLEQMLAIKKREIPALKKKMRGKTVSAHRYPFNRGTGNYLNTLLDAWILDENESWLQQAEAVIRKTIHPLDVVEHRDLLDVENRWSYLVLLAALFRYLYLKRQVNGYDEQYEYTKASVLRYTHWMLNNERPFMEDQSQLEFPNDTWVAQDVRKAMLMFQASELDDENADQYRELGKKWLKEHTGTLKHSKESHFSRILIILMQNYGPQLLENPNSLSNDATAPAHQHWTPPVLTWKLLLSRLGGRLLRALVTFRPSHERHWLNTRLDRH